MIEHYDYGRVAIGEFRRYPQPRTHDIAWEFKRCGIVCSLIENLALELFNVPFPDRPLSLLVALAIGAGCFAAMGLGLTSIVRSAEGSSAVVNFVYLPMAIISGTFLTPKGYPAFLRAIADVLPLTYYTKLMREVMVRHHHIWAETGSIAVVAVWGAVGVAAAIRGFTWEPRER